MATDRPTAQKPRARRAIRMFAFQAGTARYSFVQARTRPGKFHFKITLDQMELTPVHFNPREQTHPFSPA